MKYACLDTETTGVKPGTDRLIELAVGLYDSGKITGTHYGLHHPGIPIPAGASAVHGWTDDKVATAPRWERRHADELLEVLQAVGGPIYVHNVDFDRGILAGEFKRVGADVDALLELPWSCTLIMARELWPGQDNTMGAVAARLDVEIHGPEHLASTDVDTLSRCVEQLVHRYAHRGHKGALVKATTAVPALAVSDSQQVEALAAAALVELARRVVAAQGWVASFSCDDDDDERNGHEALGQLKKLQAEGEAKRKGVVEPIKRVTAQVDQAFRDQITKPCDAARGQVEAKLGTYAAAKLAEQRRVEAEARRKLEAERARAEADAKAARKAQAEAEAEAARVQARLERAELEARRAGDAEAVAKAEAAKLQAQARAQHQAEVERQAELERQAVLLQAQAELAAASADDGPVKGATASGGYKSKWTVTIVDPSKVPDIYWQPDLQLVQRAVDSGARMIPGCEIKEQLVVSNRRRG